MKKYEEAVTVIWKAYDALKETRNVVMAAYLMIQLGDVYFEMGEKDLARVYLSLAQKSIDRENHVRLSKISDFYASKIGAEPQTSYDLVFDEGNHAVTERKLGRIDFKTNSFFSTFYVCSWKIRDRFTLRSIWSKMYGNNLMILRSMTIRFM